MEISATFICVVYALSAALICHQQAAVDQYDGGVFGDFCGGPVVTGCTLFLLGELGNLYHHCLLTELRKRGEKSYVIPTTLSPCRTTSARSSHGSASPS